MNYFNFDLIKMILNPSRNMCLIFILFISNIFSGLGNTNPKEIAEGKRVRTRNKMERIAISLNDTIKLKSDTATYFLMRGANGLIVMPSNNFEPLDENITFHDTMIVNPIYLPVVFDGKLLPQNLDFTSKDSLLSGEVLYLISPDSTFAPQLTKMERNKKLITDYAINNPSDVKYSTYMLKLVPVIKEKDLTKKNVFKDLISTEDPVGVTTPDVQKFVPKRVYWIKNGEHSLQLAQNYISDNWYRGGNSNLMVRSYQKYTANYKKDKVTFNNIFEWRLNVQNSAGDTIHDYIINDDWLRFFNVFGYKAFNKWSYSTSLETKTQMFNSYSENSTVRQAAFLSPLFVNLGIGMTYNLDKKYADNLTKNIRLSVNLSPLSLNYRYVGNSKVDVTKYRIEEGKRSKTEYGSLVNADMLFNFNKFVSWTSRFKYFTNYERVEGEFENRLDMALNRYFSTTISLFLRYDDSAAQDTKIDYFQVNELLSFGLNYKW